nr:MAG TPA: hypothetical protein [Caudoviricetes sp.]
MRMPLGLTPRASHTLPNSVRVRVPWPLSFRESVDLLMPAASASAVTVSR